MLPSHLNGHSPLARRPRLSAATGDTPPSEAAEAAAGDAALEAHDRVYFQSYSHIGIHEAMIKVSPPDSAARPLSPWKP
jgi:protein arginine N-methyltransferase 6